MPLSFTGLSLFEAYVEKVMRAYDACGMAVAIVDQGQPGAGTVLRVPRQGTEASYQPGYHLWAGIRYQILHLSGNPPSGPAGKNRPGRTGQPVYSIFS